MKKEEKSKGNTAYDFLFGSNKDDNKHNEISNNDNFDTFNSTKNLPLKDKSKELQGVR